MSGIVWYWPQIVIVAMFTIRVVNCCIHHGESDGNKDAWKTIIAAILVLFVLYCGGFFAGATP